MSGFSQAAGAPARNRLVGFGLALVILGWVILFAAMALSDAVLAAGSLVAVLSLKADALTLAQTLIGTGLGLSVLGGLREGFGALNRFFDAVLQRSAPPRPAPMPEPTFDELETITAPPAADRTGPAPMPSSSRERNYTILPDGSVEVETLLGTRVFASMDEARDFIR